MQDKTAHRKAYKNDQHMTENTRARKQGSKQYMIIKGT